MENTSAHTHSELAPPNLPWFSCDGMTKSPIPDTPPIPDDFEHDMLLTGKLLPDLRKADDGSDIKGREDWERQRERIAGRFFSVVGKFPPRQAPLDVKWGESVNVNSYTRREVSFAGEPGERISAFLLVPKHLPGKTAAVLCPHPTQIKGKAAGAIPGVADKDGYQYAFELAERGFITIVPDHFTIPPRGPKGGEYNSEDFQKKHPDWSPVGKQAWDVMRCLDFLETLPEVDAARIGCIGLSLGGNTTLWTSAFEPRIRAAVVACGCATLRGDRNRTYNWVRPGGRYHYMPKLAAWFERNEYPFELHEIAALIAPRALMVQSGFHDEWCPGSAVMGEFAARVHDMYDLAYGKPEAFAHIHHGEHHSFARMWRETAYLWLERWLYPERYGK